MLQYLLPALGSGPMIPGASQHDLRFTDKSIYVRRANCQEIHSMTACPPPIKPTHTQWHDKAVNDVLQLRVCKNTITQLLVSLIVGPKIPHGNVWPCTLFTNHDTMLFRLPSQFQNFRLVMLSSLIIWGYSCYTAVLFNNSIYRSSYRQQKPDKGLASRN